MGKYIVELPENTHWIQWIMEGTEDHHPYMDYKTMEDLMPYTEPDLEQVRKEAYEQGRKDGRIEGQAEVWVMARNIDHMSDDDIKACFECGFSGVFEKYTASEAIEKIRQYERGKEERITNGDVVRMKSAPEIEILVTCADEGHVSGIALTEVDDSCKIGDQFTDIVIHKVEKTGRHYEIAEVLRKIREG